MRSGLTVEASGLDKRYGDMRVLAGIDLQVNQGSVFALLGPNGAGKTTTVKILSTLIEADGGHARVAGFDVVSERREVRRRISLTGQNVAVDGLQTAAENLRTMGRLRGLERRVARRRAAELLERFDLVDAADRRVGTFSGGMRRRLDVAAGLIGEPEVIFLDEPTTGLDPRSRQVVWEIVRELVQGGVSALLTTQYLEEADQLADRIAVLDGGQIVAAGTAAELKRRVGQARLELTLRDDPAFAAVAEALGPRVVHADHDAHKVAIATDGGAPEVRALLDRLDPNRTMVTDFKVPQSHA